MALGLPSLHNVEHVLPYLSRLLASIQTLPDTSLLVVTHNGAGLRVVGAQALVQGLSVVVAALNQRLARDVVLHVLLGRVEGTVVRASGGWVDETAGDALDEKAVVNLQLNGVLESLFALLEHGVEAFGLRDGTGEAVKDEARGSQLVQNSMLRRGQLGCVHTLPGTPCCW